MTATAFWVIQKMEAWAPNHLAEEWDNVGLLVGDVNQSVRKILVSLDATEAVVNEAVEGGFDWLITHHPLIFNPISRITASEPLGRKLMKLIKHHIGLFCAHTNLDMAKGGVNDVLFDILGLTQKGRLMEQPELAGSYADAGENQDMAGISKTEHEGCALGRVGLLPHSLPLSEFVLYIKERLPDADVRYAGKPETIIRKVGLCAGDASGECYMRAALKKGCDAYVTGDLRHHMAQDYTEAGLSLVDITHFSGEAPIIETIIQYLRNEAAHDGISLLVNRAGSERPVFKR